MDIISVLETFGVPIAMCFAFGIFIWKQNRWIQEDLKKDLEEQSKRLEDIVIDDNNQFIVKYDICVLLFCLISSANSPLL